MAVFTDISIIYNPNSTGDSKAMAFELRRELRTKLKGTVITCVPTEYAGHARELACKMAQASRKPLIISSSGDGGYNEVVNGIMDAGKTHATAAVLPAGNANDHSRTMQKRPLLEAILKAKPRYIDLLKVTVKDGKKPLTRYAHSYAGLGLTPAVGQELNKHDLNKFNEILLSLQTFSKFEPFEIIRHGKSYKFDSLLFGNINQMAKVLTISPKNKPDDGKFEVVSFPTSSKVKLIQKLAKAAITKLETKRSMRLYTFKTIHKMPMQLDGEIITLPPHANVRVESAHKALRTIV